MLRLILPLTLLATFWFSCGGSNIPIGDIPKPEHPRPDFERAKWANLNGQWQFRFDPLDEGLAAAWSDGEGFDRSITVPFCWESELSGIQDLSGQQIGWYARDFTVPTDWDGSRVWLRFGAVDWEARVWVDGNEIGTHEGGYSTFEFDISDHVAAGETARVVVRAFDPTDRHLPTGKQVARWYTFTSGIWQTVWLEARPATYVDGMFLIPRRDGDQWSLEVRLELAGESGSTKVQLESSDSTVSAFEGQATAPGGFATQVRVKDPKLWTPETPHLYPLTVRVGEDEVKTYFGLRTITRGRYGDAKHESVLLNDKPIYLRGALDQSFNPKGIHTAPDDDFLRRDMEIAKKHGLNFLRIHIKPDEPRRSYWADKLGVLLMQDMPNAWEYSEKSKANWEPTMRATIRRDRNHPAIFSWCLFNETWGLGTGRDYGDDFKADRGAQQWVLAKFEEAKALDPTRLIEDNSPNKYDHVKTDLNSWHFYIDDYNRARDHIAQVVRETNPGSAFNYVPGYEQGSAPLINSEYGAVSAGGGDRDISWGFRYLTTQLRKYSKIQGYIYTELTDIEFEHNGFVNYDRTPKEYGYEAFVDSMTVADLQGPDFVGFDAPPLIEAAPGSKVSIPVFVSHFSDVQDPPTLKAWLTATNDLGGNIELFAKDRQVKWRQYEVVDQTPIVIDIPDIRDYVGAIGMELVSADGERLAANFVNVLVKHEETSPRVERIGPRRTALRVVPHSFSAVQWNGQLPFRFLREGKFFGTGSGTVEYRFDVPEPVLAAKPLKLELLIELAAKAAGERLSWPRVHNPLDYPQTDARKHPSQVRIRLADEDLGSVPLPDDPADARGALSHHAKFNHGSYGFLVRKEVELDDRARARLARRPVIRLVLEAGDGGLSVHGERTGRYPVDPTVIVHTEQGL